MALLALTTRQSACALMLSAASQGHTPPICIAMRPTTRSRSQMFATVAASYEFWMTVEKWSYACRYRRYHQ